MNDDNKYTTLIREVFKCHVETIKRLAILTNTAHTYDNEEKNSFSNPQFQTQTRDFLMTWIYILFRIWFIFMTHSQRNQTLKFWMISFFWVRGSILWLDLTNKIWIFRPYHPINFFIHLFSIKSAFHSFYSNIFSKKYIHQRFLFNFAKYVSILFKNNLESNIYYFRLETIISSTKM